MTACFSRGGSLQVQFGRSIRVQCENGFEGMEAMPVITDIIKQKNNPKRYSIFIDDTFFVGASDYIIVKYHLKKGMSVDKEVLRQACLEDAIERAKSYVLHYHLAKPEKVIINKLQEKGYEGSVIAAVMEFLQKHQLLDDRKHAQQYTEQAIHSKKYGKQKIKMKLQQKGIRAADIEHALEAVTHEDELEAARKLVHPKLQMFQKKSANIYERKQRIARFLMSRGFSQDVIQSILFDSSLLSQEE